MTAGSVEDPVGLTASSVTLVEGEPWRMLVVISDTSDVYDVVVNGAPFVVQVLDTADRALADRIAGLSPAPGGMFREVGLATTDWGPRLADHGTLIGCQTESLEPVGFQHLLIGRVEQIAVHDLTDPLLYYRGRYRSLHEQDGNES